MNKILYMAALLAILLLFTSATGCQSGLGNGYRSSGGCSGNCK